MKKLQTIVLSIMAVLSCALVPAVASVSTVSAADTPQQAICRGSGGTPNGTNCDYTSVGSTTTLPQLIQKIINILLFIIGAVSVIMIIIGGIKYTTSNGDQSQVKSAKDTILYAIVGIVVAFMAYAIVGFVVKQF